jgi:hypothetical protein
MRTPGAYRVGVASTMSVAVPVTDASWIFDHKNIGLQGSRQIEFENTPVVERIVLAATVVFLLLSIVFLLPSG